MKLIDKAEQWVEELNRRIWGVDKPNQSQETDPTPCYEKRRCMALAEMRREIARRNDIPFHPAECTSSGEDCRYTCPKCDTEVKYLENEIRRRVLMGKPVYGADGSVLSLDADSVKEFSVGQLGERLNDEPIMLGILL